MTKRMMMPPGEGHGCLAHRGARAGTVVLQSRGALGPLGSGRCANQSLPRPRVCRETTTRQSARIVPRLCVLVGGVARPRPASQEQTGAVRGPCFTECGDCRGRDGTGLQRKGRLNLGQRAETGPRSRKRPSGGDRVAVIAANTSRAQSASLRRAPPTRRLVFRKRK